MGSFIWDGYLVFGGLGNGAQCEAHAWCDHVPVTFVPSA